MDAEFAVPAMRILEANAKPLARKLLEARREGLGDSFEREAESKAEELLVLIISTVVRACCKTAL
jgi:hypothetical protein